MPGFLLRLLACVLPVPLAAQVAEEPGPSELPGIVGVVLERESLEPVEGAAVTLRLKRDSLGELPGPETTVSNAGGNFGFRGLPDGVYEIEIERIGYRTLVDSIAYREALGLRIAAELVPEAVELEPLLVAVEARSRTLEATGFYDRRARGVGRFITRDEIEERDPLLVTDLLVMMPGVRLARRSRVGQETVVLMRGGCVPIVFLDGVRTVPPFPLDAALHPDDVAGIEVYHASEIPARYGISGCGAVLVWTRLPEADELGGGWSWRKTLGALGFLLLAFFLTR